MRWGSGCLLIGVLWVTAVPGVDASDFDALGAPAAGRAFLVANPAAPTTPGFATGAGVLEWYLGTDLRLQHVRLQWVGRQLGSAMHVGMVRSPVHSMLQAALALQLRSRTWRLGGTAGLQHWSFSNGINRQRWQLQLAAGLPLGALADVTLHVHPPLNIDEQPQLALQVNTSYFAPLHFLVRENRTAGFPAHRRYGVAWNSGDLWLRLGYDQQTQASSVGLALGAGKWGWEATAQSHPDLGWSRSWWLEFAP